jgi:hypothetical protein
MQVRCWIEPHRPLAPAHLGWKPSLDLVSWLQEASRKCMRLTKIAKKKNKKQKPSLYMDVDNTIFGG